MSLSNCYSFLLLAFIGFLACTPEKEENSEQEESSEQILVSSDQFWSERMAQSVMHRHSEAWMTENEEAAEWDYKIGLLLTSFEKLYEKTKEEKYQSYIVAYGNKMIAEDGTIADYKSENYNIDMINPGKILFNLHEHTQNEKYLLALQTLRKQLDDHPRTNAGGFWHKKIYPYQMWLDGLYMGTPFYARYNLTYENGDKMEDIIHQYNEIQAHLLDEETGLLYHGWDESKQMDWADKTTGRSPGFWGRSLGWYMMAMVDVLDYIPADHPGRTTIIGYLNDLSAALITFQDESGLWYQVPDQAGKEGNYLEASSSSMFVYSLLKGVRKGYISSSYQENAEDAYAGIIKELIKVEPTGEIHIHQTCGSAGLGGNPYRDGTYSYYTNEEIVTDDLHSLGPFILASLEIEALNQ